jgi:hypothetical protein
LGWYELDYLGKLQVLTLLSLYIRKPNNDRVTFHRDAPFPALEYFKLVSGVLRLTSPEKGMPKLVRLKICFNARRGGNYRGILDGIQHLEKLREVVASIGLATGAEESDYIDAESAVHDIVGKQHPSEPILVKVKRVVDPVDEGYDPPEIQEVQETESSSKNKEEEKEIDIRKEDWSIKQPGTSGKLPPGTKETRADCRHGDHGGHLVGLDPSAFGEASCSAGA